MPEKTPNNKDNEVKKLEQNTETKKKPEPKETASNTDKATIPPRTNKAESKQGLSLVALALAIVALVLVLLGGYWLWNSANNQQAELAAQQQQLVEQFTQKVAALEQQNQTLNNELEKNANFFKKEQQRLADKIKDMGPVEEYRWRIKEAAELVTQAEQRLVLTASGDAALRLLERADKILAEDLHRSVLPLREQLLATISTMEAFASQDFTGHWLKLKNWEKTSVTLPLRTREKSMVLPEGDDDADLLTRITSRLPLEIRRPDEDLEVPLSDQAGLLAETLLAGALQEARLGLLQQQPEVYKEGLGTAKDVLKRFYKTSHAKVEQAMEQLDELAAMSVAVNPPELGEIVATFRRAAAEDGKQ
ncbi:MAG TPA: uroporphyrinogen-III C-methyltransferase [Alcanivoracaceae bacterium]|nr:uroporphyrinogen-III C-methyltransferase [Alcanivoracaceae bacterium]